MQESVTRRCRTGQIPSQATSGSSQPTLFDPSHLRNTPKQQLPLRTSLELPAQHPIPCHFRCALAGNWVRNTPVCRPALRKSADLGQITGSGVQVHTCMWRTGLGPSGRTLAMKDIPVAISDLNSKWETLHDVDRALSVHAIHQAGTSAAKYSERLPACGLSSSPPLNQRGMVPNESVRLAASTSNFNMQVPRLYPGPMCHFARLQYDW